MPNRVRRVPSWWRRFRRNGWKVDRCQHCGHRFRWARDARHSFGNRDGRTYHGPCISLVTMRQKAEERLTTLAEVVDIAGLDERTVSGAVGLRTADDNERVAATNRVWRVFYDLVKQETVDG